MAKKNRPKWQQLGFKSFAAYKGHIKATSMANTVRSTVADMFQECLQEAFNCQAIKERQYQESTDRLKYHNLRLQGL